MEQMSTIFDTSCRIPLDVVSCVNNLSDEDGHMLCLCINWLHTLQAAMDLRCTIHNLKVWVRYTIITFTIGYVIVRFYAVRVCYS